MHRAHGTIPFLQLAAWSAVLVLVTSCGRSRKVLQIDLGGGVVMEFVRIEPGTFVMGSPPDEEGRMDEEILGDQERQSQVTITKPFYLGRHEITQSEWEAVMGSNPSYFKKGGGYPVEKVSWDDCQEFIKRLNDRFQGKHVFRLPTEAEWECACRAGTTAPRYGELDAIAWYRDNSGMSTHPVAQKAANAWGLHDMLGNVWEWCADWYGDCPGGSVADPVGPNSGEFCFRGGNWGSGAESCRAAARICFDPALRLHCLGLRLAISAP
ncbi:MAG: formylglycine-generating enzyme family protein [Spirochaetales bacterium]|nr:formylglycine-generating enzyme family protein [Spirochaetales bacterium]